MSLRDKYTKEEWEELENNVMETHLNSLDKDYLDLVKKILDEGNEKETRNGGTKSIFGYQIRHKMSDGFPLLTTKKLSFHNIWTELTWFLQGNTNLQYLVKKNNYIWVGDAFANYMKIEGDPPHDRTLSKLEFIEKIKTDDEFAKKWGELGPIYGKQWVNWEGNSNMKSTAYYEGSFGGPIHVKEGGSDHFSTEGINQIQGLLDQLKDNPDSRRLLLSAWNVADISEMVLPPCHYGFQLYTRELNFNERYRLGNYKPYDISDIIDMEGDEFITEARFMRFHCEEMDKLNIPKREISLMWNQRSVDVGLGLGYNIASYGVLLCLFAHKMNMVPGELIGNLGDTHIYLNQIEGLKEQLNRKGKKLPKIKIEGDIKEPLEDLNVILEGYNPHPPISLPLSN